MSTYVYVDGEDAFARVYAAYGGFFIVLSFAWGAVIDGMRLCTGDYVGDYCRLVGCGSRFNPSHGRSNGRGSCVCYGRWYGVQCQLQRPPPPPPPRPPPCCVG